MKKWKVLKIIGITIMIICVVLCSIGPVSILLSDNVYFPMDFLGVTLWSKAECIKVLLGLYLYLFGIPFLIGLITFVLSCLKIKNLKKNI